MLSWALAGWGQPTHAAASAAISVTAPIAGWQADADRVHEQRQDRVQRRRIVVEMLSTARDTHSVRICAANCRRKCCAYAAVLRVQGPAKGQLPGVQRVAVGREARAHPRHRLADLSERGGCVLRLCAEQLWVVLRPLAVARLVSIQCGLSAWAHAR